VDTPERRRPHSAVSASPLAISLPAAAALDFPASKFDNLLTGKHVVEANLIHLNRSDKRAFNAFRRDIECNWR
jgi:hypothetical protein